MDLIQTFPFIFFLMNLEKHFPSFAAFDDLSLLVLNPGVLIILENSEIGDPGSCLIREAVCWTAVQICMSLGKKNKGKCGCIDVSLWLFLPYSLKIISFSARTVKGSKRPGQYQL